ncbi:MAG: hypothetical protein GXP54_06595, partial [Deltaproteobacteria bacterium]|nr:hypothetical protein [Deltaproteobacteria bacterium]
MPTVLPTALLRKFRSVTDVSVRRELVARTLRDLEESSISRFLVYLLDHLDVEGVRPLYLDAILALLPQGSLTPESRQGLCLRLMESRYAPVFSFLCDAAEPTPRTASRD